LSYKTNPPTTTKAGNSAAVANARACTAIAAPVNAGIDGVGKVPLGYTPVGLAGTVEFPPPVLLVGVEELRGCF
jgi:hypothetical protein